MKPPVGVPVEPLSEQRWGKIERSLFARLEAEAPRSVFAPAAQRRVPVLAWLAAAAALGALVLVLASGALWESSDAIDRTSSIVTGVTPSHVALPGLSLDVQPESSVVVGGAPDKAMLIVVDRGSVLCDVAPRAKDSPLVVQAGAVRVRVVGTRFSVSRVDESARVTVDHGTVEVSVAGRSWRVTAGQVWSGGALTKADAAARAPVQLPPLPSAVVESAGPPQTQAPRARAEVKSATSPQAQFEEAARLERTDPAQASALYRTLAAGSGSWAQNALFASGRLEATRGNRAEAQRLLEQYLTRFPKGANADDARAVLERLR
jgi:transmembrane sensor